MADELAKGQQWRHKKNNQIYRIVEVANRYADEHRKKDYPEMVVYRDDDGCVWARQYSAFIEAFDKIERPNPAHCRECRYPYADGHYLSCSEQDDEDKLRCFDVLGHNYRSLLRDMWSVRDEQRKWQDRYNTLRLENNGLRKQMHKLRERLKEMF